MTTPSLARREAVSLVARRRALAALRDYPMLGVRTNTAFLIALLEDPRFIGGNLDTEFVDAERSRLLANLPEDPPPEAVAVAMQASEVGRIIT